MSQIWLEAKKCGVSHIAKQSVIGADLEADVEAMRLHRQAEKIIEESGIAYTFLRPNEFMQNFINFIVLQLRTIMLFTYQQVKQGLVS